VEVDAPFVVVAVTAYAMPGVSATIAGIENWASEVEVVAMWIACIDAKVPIACFPIEWSIEIAGCTESVPLPV